MTQSNYWQHKISLWLHDPVHKMFDIRHHESLSGDLARLLEAAVPDKTTYHYADMTAAGLTRAALPGYSQNSEQSGAIDFKTMPVLTHPLVKKNALSLHLNAAKPAVLHDELSNLLTKDLGLGQSFEQLRAIPEAKRPLSGFFDRRNTPEDWARALYFYLFFALQKRLRQENAGGVGGLWELLPADSRMPDHPLWHHLGLTSAIGSSLAIDPDRQLALVVFAITPVQSFISRARKLRDHWAGSVILSYLAFCAIRHVAVNLGPDHILYPSLHDQTLVEAWIGKSFHLEGFLNEQDEILQKHRKNGASIASFPNKFVFLAPSSLAGTLCLDLEAAVQKEWLRLARKIKGYLIKQSGGGETLASLFEHQISDYWQYNSAACRLAGLDDRNALEAVLHPEIWQNEYETVSAFAKHFGQAGMASARLYSASHTLAQSMLAAAKLKPARIRQPQQGEKCPLCGEHEVLHDFNQAGQSSAAEYRNRVQEFWNHLRDRENGGDEKNFAQIGKNEQLCAVCAVKRFLPTVMNRQENREELLPHIFKAADKFPSTTEIAAHRYLQALRGKGIISEADDQNFINALHAVEIEPSEDEQPETVIRIMQAGRDKGVAFSDRDKCYSLLLMDGDKMGDLINGQTLNATWADVLHPSLRERFMRPDFQPDAPLRACMDKIRLLNPALHATISDGLNSFARYAVAPVIDRLGGRLIYAGGDDVCAIMPLETALAAADAIRRAYTMGFVRYTEGGAEELTGTCPNDAGKVGTHLGKAEKISISAAVLIAHHKAPLREVLRDAHMVLKDIAKKRAGRNALAIRLKKRAGGNRDLWFQWDEINPYCDETLLTSLEEVMRDITGDIVGGSLLYRLGGLKTALEPLVCNTTRQEANRERIVDLIAYEVGHSGKSDIDTAKAYLLARRLAGLMLRSRADQNQPAPMV